LVGWWVEAEKAKGKKKRTKEVLKKLKRKRNPLKNLRKIWVSLYSIKKAKWSLLFILRLYIC